MLFGLAPVAGLIVLDILAIGFMFLNSTTYDGSAWSLLAVVSVFTLGALFTALAVALVPSDS
jgi:hypothetical protein